MQYLFYVRFARSYEQDQEYIEGRLIHQDGIRWFTEAVLAQLKHELELDSGFKFEFSTSILCRDDQYYCVGRTIFENDGPMGDVGKRFCEKLQECYDGGAAGHFKIMGVYEVMGDESLPMLEALEPIIDAPSWT